MKESWKAVRVPLIGIVAMILITVFAFAVVKPGVFHHSKKSAWSITGNVVADDSLFDTKITMNKGCASIHDPVCGTNDQTYNNLCEARKAGVDAKYRGDCHV